MSDPAMTDRFDTWASPETTITIEYQVEALDEIRQYVLYGFRLISRGGIELGGVLFGTREGDALRIQTWRPIDCEHANGPALIFSEKDHANLIRLLENSRVNPDLSSLEILGWFVSHTRAACSLTDSDVEIFNHYFPEPFQVTLVLQPLKEAVTKAAFFVREPAGTVKREASYREFTLGPLPIQALHTKTAERIQVLEPARAQLPKVSPIADDRTAEFHAAKQRNRIPPTSEPEHGVLEGRQIWVWAFMALLVAVVGVVIAWRPSKSTGSVDLRAETAGRQLVLKWNSDAEAVRTAVRGTLDIRDGASVVLVPLDPAHLKRGSYGYRPESADQEVSMNLYPSQGAPVTVSTHLEGIGPAAGAGGISGSEIVTKLRQDRDRLAAENARLKEQLKAETAHRERLEAQLKATEKKRGAAARRKKSVKR